MAKFTVKDVMSSAVGHLNGHLNDKQPESTVKSLRKPRKDSKAKQWVSAQLWAWCKEKGIECKPEQQWHPARKWRFDWYMKEIWLAVEYNGIFSEKSRHTTVTGYTGDMDKINAAQSWGITVLQYTPLNYKTLIKDLDNYYEKWQLR